MKAAAGVVYLFFLGSSREELTISPELYDRRGSFRHAARATHLCGSRTNGSSIIVKVRPTVVHPTFVYGSGPLGTRDKPYLFAALNELFAIITCRNLLVAFRVSR